MSRILSATFADVSEAIVRSTPNARLAELWAIALATEGIDARVETRDGAFVIVTTNELHEYAAKVLDDLYREEEEADEDEAPEPAKPRAPQWGRTWAGAIVAWALLAFFAVRGAPGSAWFDLGEASAARIVAGEWWRAVTAMTLHADLPHVLSNAVAAAVFMTALGWRIVHERRLNQRLLDELLENEIRDVARSNPIVRSFRCSVALAKL